MADLTLEEVVYQGLGEASMCWSETPKGVFDSTHAAHIGDEIIQAIQEEKNAIYTERNLCVALIAFYAVRAGHAVWINDHQGEEWDDEWRNVLFIELPTGQISWHLHRSELENFPDIPKRSIAWDGHTTEEKHKRIQNFIHPSKKARVKKK